MPQCGNERGGTKQGPLPELLPAGVMHHSALQQLQLQLIPFQVKLFRLPDQSAQCKCALSRIRIRKAPLHKSLHASWLSVMSP